MHLNATWNPCRSVICHTKHCRFKSLQGAPECTIKCETQQPVSDTKTWWILSVSNIYPTAWLTAVNFKTCLQGNKNKSCMKQAFMWRVILIIVSESCVEVTTVFLLVERMNIAPLTSVFLHTELSRYRYPPMMFSWTLSRTTSMQVLYTPTMVRVKPGQVPHVCDQISDKQETNRSYSSTTGEKTQAGLVTSDT